MIKKSKRIALRRESIRELGSKELTIHGAWNRGGVPQVWRTNEAMCSIDNVCTFPVPP